MTILITGVAGFIGYHLAVTLLKSKVRVIGIDNINEYYDIGLKQARLNNLKIYSNFIFYKLDIAETKAILNLKILHPHITHIIHLAAQAGVRYSLSHPHTYTHSNIEGHLNILELCRQLIPNQFEQLVYASSSSVYGANTKLPFSIKDPVDTPMSLYAATKRANELMSYTYSHLYKIPATGLRFFTVYGPWGRPDMSAFIFTKAILDGQELPVFNQGHMRRNFSYIEDIIGGIIACLNKPPFKIKELNSCFVPHRLYNLGNDQSESLLDFIKTLEKIIGKKAILRLEDMQPGDVKETIADISETTRDLGFIPKTNISEGLTHFVNWYKNFYG
ncbi:MAG: capsular biosynthesis protein CpsI [Francisellaceae bacterium]|nr:capsular biosynthesis protein CpsI [Francisellaceae bacterium]